MTPPGWYPDPWQQAARRWWDGTAWTGYVWGVPATQRVLDARRTGRWLQLALPLQPLSAAVSLAVTGAVLRSFIQDFDVDDPSSFSFPSWLPLVNLLTAVGVVVVVLQVLWMHRAGEAAEALGLPLRRSPGLAAAGWIIPVVNLWWPYQGLRDLFPATDRPRARLGWWWACYLGAGVLSFAALGGAFAPVGVHVALGLLPLVPAIAAVVLQWRLIREAGDLHARLAGLSASAPSTAGGG